MFFDEEMNEGFFVYFVNSGADLSALVREASEFALKEFIRNPVAENEIVRLRHFEKAFNKIKPSVSAKVGFLFEKRRSFILIIKLIFLFIFLKDCEKYEKMKALCVNLEV